MGKKQVTLVPPDLQAVEQQNKELQDKVVALETRIQALEQQVQGGVS
jgi:cell division protein FtsB